MDIDRQKVSDVARAYTALNDGERVAFHVAIETAGALKEERTPQKRRKARGKSKPQEPVALSA